MGSEPRSGGAAALTAEGAQRQPPDSAFDLPFCHSRREFDSQAGIFFCAHPLVHSAGDLVNVAVCRGCNRWQQPPPARFKSHPSGTGRRSTAVCLHLGDQTGLRGCNSCAGHVQLKVFACHHPDHDSVTLDECCFCEDYELQLSRGSVQHWSIGITTAPRAKPTLERCLTSLKLAGWEDVRIFAEPLTPIPRSVAHCPITWRESKLGAWPNWYLALTELYFREPIADAYVMVQDDSLFCHGLRQYLESVLWPQPRVGYVTLYNPLAVQPEGPSLESLPPDTLLPGAVALVFPNFAARMLLADTQLLMHRRRGPTEGLAQIDAVVSNWAKRQGLAELIHVPSLAQHVGDTTSIGAAEQDRHRRFSASFVGEAFDARQWLVSPMDQRSMAPKSGR